MLEVGQVLHESRSVIRHVYFPVDCVISLLAPLDGHPGMEVATVGNEGLVGGCIALGAPRSISRSIVQGSGTALRMTAAACLDEIAASPALEKRLGRYLHSLMAQLTRTAGCIAFHPLEARLARWLLTMRARMHSDELEVTHELLAQMLGVRREAVTLAAGHLQRHGLIRYSRGRVAVADADGLSQAACDCYRAGHS